MGRRLGQHFLTDPAILDRIVDAIDPGPDDVVIEIGPGKGTLTRRLAPRVGHVVAIEKDAALAQQLREECRVKREEYGHAQVTIVEGDALTLDWTRLTAAPTLPSSLYTLHAFKVIGNIPYYITSPLIEKALTTPLPSVIVFLVQREFAGRLTAAPGGKEYGALSAGVQAIARVEKLFVVRAGAFHPPPKVDSAVVRLTPRKDPTVRGDEHPRFRAFLAAVFSQRRKQLGRALRGVTGMSKEDVLAVLDGIGIDPASRAEVLTVDQLTSLFRRTQLFPDSVTE
ncbi:MAG: ribosomal RNA small subunit methyltransferase A [Gemmatimonadetes bacterium]|nr:ribosomal RNA small subunit methyltransferase A [Gemmatimonadota bacterium]